MHYATRAVTLAIIFTPFLASVSLAGDSILARQTVAMSTVLTKPVQPNRLIHRVQTCRDPSANYCFRSQACCPGHAPHTCPQSPSCFVTLDDALRGGCPMNDIEVCGRPAR